MTWTAEKQRSYMEQYYKDHPEKWSRSSETEERKILRLAKAREYHAKNKDKIRERKKERAAEIRVVQRNGRNLKKFGITPEIYEATLVAQDNECAICQSPFTKTPAIDHCHETGQVRALLCSKCNTALGLFGESISVVRAATSYLEAWDEMKAAMLKARAAVAKQGGAGAQPVEQQQPQEQQ